MKKIGNLELTLQIKGNGHKAQAFLLDNMGGTLRLQLTDHERNVKFAHAYAAVDEVTRFAVDTETDNTEMDTEVLKAKIEMAITKVTEYQIAMTGLQTKNAGQKAQYDAEMDLVNQALKALGEANEDADKLVMKPNVDKDQDQRTQAEA